MKVDQDPKSMTTRQLMEAYAHSSSQVDEGWVSQEIKKHGNRLNDLLKEADRRDGMMGERAKKDIKP